jgi:hypothetical protein
MIHFLFISDLDESEPILMHAQCLKDAVDAVARRCGILGNSYTAADACQAIGKAACVGV